MFGPRKPDGVGGGNVQQYVGFEKKRAYLDTAPEAPVCDRLKAELDSTRLVIFVMPWTWGLLGRGGLACTRGGCAPLCSSGQCRDAPKENRSFFAPGGGQNPSRRNARKGGTTCALQPAMNRGLLVPVRAPGLQPGRQFIDLGSGELLNRGFDFSNTAHPALFTTGSSPGQGQKSHRCTRAPTPFINFSTSLLSAMEVSPGVVMARAPWAAPYSTAFCGSPVVIMP